MKTIVIEKGWYWSAGRKFGWKDVDTVGVGINVEAFTGDEICVKVDGKKYSVDVAEAKKFIKKYRSVIRYSFNKIGVVSRSLLKPMFEVEKTLPVVRKELQNKLF